jgi:hypothetical protein
MTNNLFISYDLYKPGQSYDHVIQAIKQLGAWAKVQKSLWYVKSPLSASEALDRVWKVMDANDSLIVVDSTNNEAAWRNLSDEVSNYLKTQWIK